MNKVKEIALIAFAGLAFMLLTGIHKAHADGFFSGIKDAIVGHAEDFKGRIADGEVLEGVTIVKEGTFDEDAVGQDFAHYAKGTAQIVELDGKFYVQLTEDFTSGPLPDGHVYISKDVDINEEKDFNFDTQIDLGKLKKSNGAGYYEIPSSISIEDINSVTIWCKRFGAYIGSADVMKGFN